MTVSSHALEHIILALAAVVFLGILIWIIQALDGARLATRHSPLQEHASNGWISFALLASMAAFVIMFKPVNVAGPLDRYSVSMQQEGFKIIPLYLARVASHLDPSRPEYAMHVIELYDDLGMHDTARIKRDELLERWRPCLETWRQRGLLNTDGTISLFPENPPTPYRGSPGRWNGGTGTWARIETLYGDPDLP
jgi:hypothetical protein